LQEVCIIQEIDRAASRWSSIGRRRVQSDPVQLVHCPGCLSSDVRLSRQRKAWDLVMRILLATPLRCRICAKRFYKRVQRTQLLAPTTLGRSPRSVPGSPPLAEQRAPAVLVVEDLIPFSKLIRKRLARRGFAVFAAKHAEEGLALFRAQPRIDMAVIGLVTPTAGNLDLAAELERLRPGLPVLYLVGAGKTIARCSIEAQAPDSVLAVPFTEEQLIARVDALIEAAARQGPDERLWERLIAVSDWIPSPIAMLQVYETGQAALAEGHVAMLSVGNVQHAFRTTNCKAAPYGVAVCARDISRARCLIGQVSADRQFVVAA
jgi:DNA-binding response OmpR family regulator